MREYMREYIIIAVTTIIVLSILIYLSFGVTQTREYDLNDRFHMTNCTQVKEGNAMKLSYTDYEGIVICDEGEYTYHEYTVQYTLDEIIRFKELYEELED